MQLFKQLFGVKYEVIIILKNYSLDDWGVSCFRDLVKAGPSLFNPYSCDERSHTFQVIIAGVMAYSGKHQLGFSL
jgi:spore maturation protein CgeB